MANERLSTQILELLGGLVSLPSIKDMATWAKTFNARGTVEEARADLNIGDVGPFLDTILGTDATGKPVDGADKIANLLWLQMGSAADIAATTDFDIPFDPTVTSYVRVIDADLTITGVTGLPTALNHSAAPPDAEMRVYLIMGAGGPYTVDWDAGAFRNEGGPLDLFPGAGNVTAFNLLHPPLAPRTAVQKYSKEFQF